MSLGMNNMFYDINFDFRHFHYFKINYHLKQEIEESIVHAFGPADNFGIYGLIKDEILQRQN